MATKEMSNMVSEDLLDEVWLMMHMAAEMGSHHVDEQEPTPERQSLPGAGTGSRARFMFEAEVEPEYLKDVVETDHPGEGGDDKEKALIQVAQKLMEMGDSLNERNQRQEEVEKVSQDIADYIKQVMAPDIEQKLGSKFSRATATSLFAETGILGLVYGVFKKKVEDFIGSGEDVANIALVTSITKGVASGLDQSSSGVAGLLATVSTTFVKEKYGSLLQTKESLTSIVTESEQSTAQPEQQSRQ